MASSKWKTNKNWNPFFRALWEHSRTKPHAVEDHPWGDDVVFKFGGKNGKIFTFLGYPGAEDAGVTVKPSPEELGGLLGLPFVQRAAYIGRYGWITVKVRDRRSLKLALDLVDDTYHRVADAATKRGQAAARRKAGSRTTLASSPKRGRARMARGGSRGRPVW